jgi:hypothetical protein
MLLTQFSAYTIREKIINNRERIMQTWQEQFGETARSEMRP